MALARLAEKWLEKCNTAAADVISQRESVHDKMSNVSIEQKQLMEMFYHLEGSVAVAHMGDVKKDNWNYIPYSHLRFYETLQKIPGVSFLEMGCGLGTKLYIASNWCKIEKVDGIEINPTYTEVAQQMVGNGGNVFCMDVRDFKRYRKYDIIYTYGEIRNRRGTDIVAKVKQQMKSGAMLLQAYLNCPIDCWMKP